MINTGALVAYKGKAAVVAFSGDRLELALEGGDAVKVREKDIVFLHPGPLAEPPAPRDGGDFETARQMIAGETVEIRAACELVFGEYAAGTALACWNAALDGSLFRAEGDRIVALTDEEREREASRRARKEGEAAEREAFIARAKRGVAGSGDERFLGEIESLALGKIVKSRIAAEIGLSETPEAAHAFLVCVGRWTATFNPWPLRSGLPLKAPVLPLGSDDDDGRLDFTGFASYAIDNAWSRDPDDAIAFEDGAVFVSIADPASVVTPGSSADAEAADRSGTLYLPELTVPMLPDEALPRFGLGLSEVSRALSFRIELDDSGAIGGIGIFPSFVRVERHSYESAMELLPGPLDGLDRVATLRARLRAAAGAIDIDIPEVRIWVADGVPAVEPVPHARSGAIVREMMVLCGEAAARWAFERGIPFPYYGQEAPQIRERLPSGLAGEFAKRKLMKAGSAGTHPSAHRGLGLSFYAQATSPLRRYGDLLAHQQLRAALAGRQPLDEDELASRLGRALAALALNRQAERASELHWTLAWLAARPGWEGDGVVTGSGGGLSSVYIPDLGLETRIKAGELEDNASVRMKCTGVDIPRRDARWSTARAAAHP
ncbi:MAG: RNB domain-containing ribonuclease [Spirochaetes bacterium]|nr:RNB domain-containing ribonuclease [Spirochaetota bacterium]